jgi:hypothetical protein
MKKMRQKMSKNSRLWISLLEFFNKAYINKIKTDLVWSGVQVSLVVLPQSSERLLHSCPDLFEIRQRRRQLPILPVQLQKMQFEHTIEK